MFLKLDWILILKNLRGNSKDNRLHVLKKCESWTKEPSGQKIKEITNKNDSFSNIFLHEK